MLQTQTVSPELLDLLKFISKSEVFQNFDWEMAKQKITKEFNKLEI